MKKEVEKIVKMFHHGFISWDEAANKLRDEALMNGESITDEKIEELIGPKPTN